MQKNSPIKTITFAVPGDLHLIGRLRLSHAGDFKAYFNEAESIAKKILRADEFYMQHGRRPVREEALDRMKRIALVIRGACEEGRRALKQRKKNEALTHAYRILDFRAELFSEPDRYRGEKLVRGLSRSGKERARPNRQNWVHWQSRAEEIRRLRLELSIRKIAHIIECETGGKFETIRKVIGKSLKNNVKTPEG